MTWRISGSLRTSAIVKSLWVMVTSCSLEQKINSLISSAMSKDGQKQGSSFDFVTE
jgi:hypothetical protein